MKNPLSITVPCPFTHKQEKVYCFLLPNHEIFFNGCDSNYRPSEQCNKCREIATASLEPELFYNDGMEFPKF